MRKKYLLLSSVLVYGVVMLNTGSTTICDEQSNRDIRFLKDFGQWSIDLELFDFIRNNLSTGKTLLELGSGWASGQFSKYYTVYSIEHDQSWVGRYNTNYIYAPIKDGWYDINVLMEELPRAYDLILIDGPPSSIGRKGFYEHLDLFKIDVIMIFDDVNRKPEYELLINVAKKLKREYKIYQGDGKKQFGVLFK